MLMALAFIVVLGLAVGAASLYIMTNTRDSGKLRARLSDAVESLQECANLAMNDPERGPLSTQILDEVRKFNKKGR